MIVEYKKKLDHLNLAELAFVLKVDLEQLLNTITQKKELHVRDIPIIATYGDLCIIQGAIFRAEKALLSLLKKEEDSVKKADESFYELENLFKYVDNVLMDGNISKKDIHRLDPTVEIPD